MLPCLQFKIPTLLESDTKIEQGLNFIFKMWPQDPDPKHLGNAGSGSEYNAYGSATLAE
jgi:hypothetical protein